MTLMKKGKFICLGLAFALIISATGATLRTSALLNTKPVVSTDISVDNSTGKLSFNYGPDGGPNIYPNDDWGYAETIIKEGGVIQYGDVGHAVKDLQNALCGPTGCLLDEDGYFGDATLAAVIKFQNIVCLNADGVVGLHTWTDLEDVSCGIPVFYTDY